MSVFGLTNIENTDLFLVGITTAAILLLGIIVFLSNRKSITNRTFLLVAFAATFYSVINYVSYQVGTYEYVLWFIRLTIFFAVWYAFALFQLFYVFPKEESSFPRSYKLILLPVVVITSLLTLTPFVFPRLAVHNPPGIVSTPEAAPGSLVFGLVSLFLLIGAMYLLARKTLKATGVEKRQFSLVLIGTVLTFGAMLLFNVLLTLVGEDASFIAWTPVFTLPFIILTTYAILKHKMLHVKVVAAEVMTFLLASVVFIEAIFTQSMWMLVFRVSIFILVLVFGVLFIRSVRREVEQRERIEILAEDLKRKNTQLRALMNMKTEFMQIASHQLRTPVSVIKGVIDMLRGGDLDNAPPEKRKEYLDRAYTKSEKLNEIITDILSATEMDSPEFDLKEALKPVDLKDMAKSAVDSHQPLAEQHGLALKFEDKGDVADVMASEQFLPQVITNFISNAIQYTPKGGTITVTVFQKDGKVVCEVSDTGIGVSPEDLKKLWQKFVRADNANNMHTDGSGLGLFIVKKIVEGHKGGEVFVRSELDKGSTFGFSLPVKG